jgi:hypothetical protein
MPFKIKIAEVNIEKVVNGRNRYEKAAVVYSFNGQNRTQNIMSFTNPAVFAKVQTMKPGEEYNVEVTKNDAGYNQWASIEAVGGASAPDSAKSSPGSPARATVSTYETADERKIKQLYIVKQSSINAAISTLSVGSKTALKVEDVLQTAQQYVDFVYGNHDEKDLFTQDNELGDVPM